MDSSLKTQIYYKFIWPRAGADGFLMFFSYHYKKLLYIMAVILDLDYFFLHSYSLKNNLPPFSDLDSVYNTIKASQDLL